MREEVSSREPCHEMIPDVGQLRSVQQEEAIKYEPVFLQIDAVPTRGPIIGVRIQYLKSGSVSLKFDCSR
jgi:hypothetical protein